MSLKLKLWELTVKSEITLQVLTGRTSGWSLEVEWDSRWERLGDGANAIHNKWSIVLFRSVREKWEFTLG
jgi:hypothetical protein